jgi:hypothetical protein
MSVLSTTTALSTEKASISGETNLIPVCWNKCYNCGEDVDITVNIGFGAVTLLLLTVYGLPEVLSLKLPVESIKWKILMAMVYIQSR